MLQAEFPAAAVGVPARTPLGGGPAAPDQCTTAWPDLVLASLQLNNRIELTLV